MYSCGIYFECTQRLYEIYACKALSFLQVLAVVAVLDRKLVQDALTPEKKATLSQMLAKVPWMPTHLSKALAALQGKNAVKTRRAQQNFIHFTNYISANEWKHLWNHRNELDAMIPFLLEILGGRLKCMNPTENTKKLVASIALYLMSLEETITMDAKQNALTFVKKNHLARQKKTRKDNQDVAPSDYIVELPYNPDEILNGSFSHLYSEFKVEGCFMKSPLSSVELNFVDNSYCCRGGNNAASLSPFMQKMISMQSTMMRSLKNGQMQGNDSQDDGGLNLRLCGPATVERSPLALTSLPTRSNELQRIASFISQSASKSQLTLDEPSVSPDGIGQPRASTAPQTAPADRQLFCHLFGQEIPPQSGLQPARQDARSAVQADSQVVSEASSQAAAKDSSQSVHQTIAHVAPRGISPLMSDEAVRRQRGDELLDAMLANQKEKNLSKESTKGKLPMAIRHSLRPRLRCQ